MYMIAITKNTFSVKTVKIIIVRNILIVDKSIVLTLQHILHRVCNSIDH